MAKSIFEKYNVSIRIGMDSIASTDITKDAFLNQVKVYNEATALKEVPTWIDHELIDESKASAWFDMISNLDEGVFSQFQGRSIYLNHEPFELAHTAPTSVNSYTSDVKFSFEYDKSALSRPAVDFGDAKEVNMELFEKCKKFLIEKMISVKELDKTLSSEAHSEDSEERRSLSDQIVYERYARFCAIKAVKRNLEVLALDSDDPSIPMQLSEVSSMFEDFIVPPVR